MKSKRKERKKRKKKKKKKKNTNDRLRNTRENRLTSHFSAQTIQEVHPPYELKGFPCN
jgi:hypothetical protein